MSRAQSNFKMARAVLTEESGGLVRVRFAVKPLNAEWNVMHTMWSLGVRGYPPIATGDEAASVLSHVLANQVFPLSET